MVSDKTNPSRLITVASGKGGVGKTWVSVTLCYLLASGGKNVLLFDGDLGLANVDIQLGLVPKRHLGQVLSGSITLEQAVTQYDNTVHFDIISGQSGSGVLASIRQQKIIELAQSVDQLSHQYDLTIMDMGAGVETAVTSLCHYSNRMIIVITGDPTSLTDAYALIKLTNRRKTNVHYDVLVNMVEDRHEGKRIYETLKKACQNFLALTPNYLGSIRKDHRVIDAIRHQKPLPARHPRSDAGDDMENILKMI